MGSSLFGGVCPFWLSFWSAMDSYLRGMGGIVFFLNIGGGPRLLSRSSFVLGSRDE